MCKARTCCIDGTTDTLFFVYRMQLKKFGKQKAEKSLFYCNSTSVLSYVSREKSTIEVSSIRQKQIFTILCQVRENHFSHCHASQYSHVVWRLDPSGLHSKKPCKRTTKIHIASTCTFLVFSYIVVCPPTCKPLW